MKKNPIVKSTIIVFGFWWLVMAGIALFRENSLHDATVLLGFAVIGSTVAALGGAAVGFALRIAWQGAKSFSSEAGLKEGDTWGGASSSLGKLPALNPHAMTPLPANIEQAAPWLPLMRKRFPQHAAAAEAVLRVMMTEPGLPASPVYGGHGGRTLIQHSLGVVESMIEEAPKWVYRGQFKKGGKKLAVKPINGPHRFTPDDFGLLILTALAHDIGKIVCYRLQPNGKVIEVKPNHDYEGARILRNLPEVMALNLLDRRALLTACGYYHHPWDIPLAPWCDDRVRSLTELLIVADHATGRKEGHQLTAHSDEPDDEDEALDEMSIQQLQDAAKIGAIIGRSIENMEMGEAADEEESASARARNAMDRRGSSSTEDEDSDEDIPEASKDAAALASRAEILGLYQLLKENPGLINGGNSRVGFKQGHWLYLCDQRIREQAARSNWDTGIPITDLVAPADGRNTNPLTVRLLNALSEAGLLKTEIDHPDEGRKARFNAISALFVLLTQQNKSKAPEIIKAPFFLVPATAFGLSDMADWPHPIKIERPFFGWNSEAGKREARAAAEAAKLAQRPEDTTTEAGAAPPDLGPLWAAINDSGLQALKIVEAGRLFDDSDEVASVIDAALSKMGLSRSDAAISSLTAPSGRSLLLIPHPSTSDEATHAAEPHSQPRPEGETQTP